MKLSVIEKRFLRALKRSASYTELGERAGLTPDEVSTTHLGLVRKGCIELRPVITNAGLALLTTNTGLAAMKRRAA